MNKELFTIGSSGDKDIASCSWTGGDAESSIRDAEIARCIDADGSGDDCSGFERGNPASCPTTCDYTAPNAAIKCCIGPCPKPGWTPTPWRTMRTGSVAGMTTGTCPSPFAFIDTRAECEDAAAVLGIDDPRGENTYARVGATLWGERAHREDNPYGCYFNQASGKLYMNDQGDRNSNDQNRVSICKDAPADWSPPVTEMTTGTCPSPFAFIETAAECEDAATVLRLDDTTATAVVDVRPGNMRADYPYGCYFDRQSGELFINDAGNRNSNDRDRVSICKNP